MITDRHRAFPPRQRWATASLLLLLACTQPSPPPLTRPRPAKPKPSLEPRAPAQSAAPSQAAPKTQAGAKPSKEDGQGEAPRPVRVRPPLGHPLLIESAQRLIRVGLATDLDSILLPCCAPETEIRMGSLKLSLDAPIRIEPAGELADRELFRLQVAALKDEGQARGIAERLRRETGRAADAVFDAGTDLYRVRVGRYASRQEAEAGRGQLEALGIADAWVASEGGNLDNAALRITQRGKTRAIEGRWLRVEGSREGGIHLGKQGRFRGRILIHVNRRGRLNLINELSLEDYLRGVVPMEMGPELYNQLEALKAQTVAARTYTIRNLGEFADEGYDICSSPRCQVYGGMAVEHHFSDRAVRETSGLVALFEGQPAETFYSATCGGHTENVEVVFPLKRGAYLRGVPCLESGEQSLAGSLPPRVPFPDGLTKRLLPPGQGRREEILTRRLRKLADLAEQPIPEDRLRSLLPRELRRFLGSVFDLALDPRLLAPRPALTQLLQKPPKQWHPREIALASHFLESGIAETAKTPIAESRIEALLLRLALYLGALETRDVHFLSLAQGRMEVRVGAEREMHPLAARMATFRGSEGRLISSPLSLMAGDRLRLYLHAGDLLAATQDYTPSRVVLGKRRPRGPWRHFRSRSQVRRAVQTRYPGFPFRDFEVLLRGVSGRVGRLLLLGDDNRNLTVEGLPVRWTLDLPDTRFTAQPHRPKNGEAGWIFSGSGWGHGVGMCQAGTFGMAMRGATYQEILNHYYTGIQLARLKAPKTKPG